MSTPAIKANIESTLTSLRDLAYEAHSEWERAGMENSDLLRLSVKTNEVMNELSQVIALAEMSFSGKPTKIRELPNGGWKKIQAIKAVREITGEGLKEAKDMVDLTANGAWSDLTFKPGFRDPDEFATKKFIADMNNAGYEVK